MFSRIRSVIIMQIALAVLGWGALLFFSPFSESISEQIANLPEHTHESLTAEIAKYKSKRQLRAEDEQEVQSMLAKLHESLLWDCSNTPVFYPRIGEDGIIPVDMKWKCTGELLLLPVYIEGLSRLEPLGILQSVHINWASKEIEFQLRFLRAEPNPPDWSDASEELSPKEIAILRQGWLLMYWKAFRHAQQERENSFDQTSFMIELSRVLTENRNSAARVDWSLSSGFTKRNF